ncbi:interleukin-12 subunit beta [Amia ocellicauda]|uniref:interleukin-12 subunit beta n=1 Tax=Amia ocellicauda TaxID=2972642 RepID=UPI003463BA1D
MLTECYILSLLVILQPTLGLNFSSNLLVAQPEGSKNLTCRTEFTGPVTWTLGGQKVEESNYRELKGTTLTLHQLQDPDTGIYSCWGNGIWLNSIHLVLEQEPEEEDEDILLCTAKTYNCSFTCSWSLEGYELARVRYNHSEEKPSSWVYAQHSDSSFQFQMSHSSSPFAEERTPFQLTAEALGPRHYRRRTTVFYIRDIIQPDAPQTVLCKHDKRETLTITVCPPHTWAQPHSYFPLSHQIEYIHQDNGKVETSNSSVIPRAVSRLRVRSRDPYFLSSWSHWSPWKNVTE